MEMERKPPSLVQICMQTAINNIRYIGNTGDMDSFLLKDLLPHANVEQLMNIEDATEGRDLSPVTDVLWKRFYEQTFGGESMDLVVKRMKEKRVVFKWRQLYEAKTKEREEAQQKSVEKFRQRYAEDLARKQSRQVQFTMKDPPSRKRSFSGGNGSCNKLSNLKGNLMKKAKMEYLNSHEARIHADMRKNSLQHGRFLPQRVSCSTKTSKAIDIGKNSGSSSRLAKPLTRGSRMQPPKGHVEYLDLECCHLKAAHLLHWVKNVIAAGSPFTCQ